MEFRMADNDLCVQGCAVVTGGARGIGKAVCESLAAAGYNVAVNHSSAGSAQTAADLARDLEERFGVSARAFEAEGRWPAERSGRKDNCGTCFPETPCSWDKAAKK